MQEANKNIIQRLQKDILSWQGFIPPLTGLQDGIGLGPLERAFPNGVFPTGNIHEMLCAEKEHAAATSGLLMGILSVLMKNNGACLWISPAKKFFPPSAAHFGVQPERLIFVNTQKDKDALWIMEEALKCEGLSVVIAEVNELSFAQSRRLQLAVESSKVTGFVLRSNLKKLSTTTCVARWQVTALPGFVADELPGVGFPRWQVELLRVRNGQPGKWELQWRNKSFVWPEEVKQPLRECTGMHLQVG